MRPAIPLDVYRQKYAKIVHDREVLGLSIYEIAKVVGTSHENISRILRKAQCPKQRVLSSAIYAKAKARRQAEIDRKEANAERVSRIIAAYENGELTESIARRFGVGQTAISGLVLRYRPDLRRYAFHSRSG